MPKSSRKELSNKKRKQKDEDEDTNDIEVEDDKEATSAQEIPTVDDTNKDSCNRNDEGDGIITTTKFSSISNLHSTLLSSISSLKWEYATNIQSQSIPPALLGRDIIGLAETGSGKTGAFVIPILNHLLEKPQKNVFAMILAPTRELAFQIHEVVVALGRGMGANSVCIVGGVDMSSQAIALARSPHVVVATPGRLLDHLENTKGFNLRQLKYLVLDEADRMLSMDFEKEINEILDVIPDCEKGRRTMLFSATMTVSCATFSVSTIIVLFHTNRLLIFSQRLRSCKGHHYTIRYVLRYPPSSKHPKSCYKVICSYLPSIRIVI